MLLVGTEFAEIKSQLSTVAEVTSNTLAILSTHKAKKVQVLYCIGCCHVLTQCIVQSANTPSQMTASSSESPQMIHLGCEEAVAASPSSIVVTETKSPNGLLTLIYGLYYKHKPS